MGSSPHRLRTRFRTPNIKRRLTAQHMYYCTFVVWPVQPLKRFKFQTPSDMTFDNRKL